MRQPALPPSRKECSLKRSRCKVLEAAVCLALSRNGQEAVWLERRERGDQEKHRGGPGQRETVTFTLRHMGNSGELRSEQGLV